jgi:hypothetical protein
MDAEPTTPVASLAPTEEPPRPTASPCGAATLALEFQRPNLYFAIDASGSMQEDIPPGDSAAYLNTTPPKDRYHALALAIEELLKRVGHRANYGATVFPSSEGTCDAGDKVFGLRQGDTVSFALSGEVGPVLSRLMSRIRQRTPFGGTPVALALDGLVETLSEAPGQSFVFLLTDGGPNCNEDLFCAIDSCIPNIENASIDGVECADGLNCCDETVFGPGNCLDATGSLAAVRRLAAAGVKTFVIGMPGTDAYAAVLDGLAEAGGAARLESPLYYRARDAAELIAAVSAVGREVTLGCAVQLFEPPPDPTLVNVYFDDTLIAFDPLDGWTWADDRTVQLVGEACRLLQTGEVLQADIIAGCPVVIR